MPPSRPIDLKVKRLKEQGALNPNPQAVQDPLFQGNVFFDPRDLVQVKYEMLRRVKVDGWSISAATQALGFSRPTFYQVDDALKKEGLPGLLPQKRGPKRAHKLTKEVVAFMEDLQQKDSSLKARGLAKAVAKEFDLIVHPRSIERALARKKKRL